MRRTGTDHAELQLLSLQSFDPGVGADAAADQHGLPQVIPEHSGQLLAVTWEMEETLFSFQSVKLSN